MTDLHLDDAARILEMFRKATFSQRFERVDAGYDEIQARYRRDAVGFNVFRVLGVHRREVKTHSAFIRELVNPYGSHQQGFLFLEEFLRQCRSLEQVVGVSVATDCRLEPQSFPDLTGEDLASYQWRVSREYDTGEYGRLDILIRCKALGFLCVIENKVDARERKDQLISYWNWMNEKERLETYPRQTQILLTPRGRETDFPDCMVYFPMSYNKHIARWLMATLHGIEASGLRAVVQQYLLTVDRLVEE